MKRVSHIVDKIRLSDLRVQAMEAIEGRQYRKAAGKRFLERFDEVAPPLLALIQSGEWIPDPVIAMDICEGGKMRHIEIPTFRDMVVQRALIYPRLEAIFMRHTWPHAFSSIKGRGPLKAAKHVSRLISKKHKAKWCLYFDVRKYYEHINRAILLEDFKRMVKDPICVAYMERIIGMGEKGLAIGNTASHFLANIYLTPVCERLRAFPKVSDVITYMDNVFIFGSNKKALHTVRRAAIDILAERGLSMKDDWQVFRTDKRAVHIGGFCVKRRSPWRIYKRTFHHLKQAVQLFQEERDLHTACSLASLRGWIVTAKCIHFYRNRVAKTWKQARKVIVNEARARCKCAGSSC